MKVFLVILQEDYEPECGRAMATEANVMGVFDTRDKAEALIATKPRVVVDGQELRYTTSDYDVHYLIEEWEVK